MSFCFEVEISGFPLDPQTHQKQYLSNCGGFEAIYPKTNPQLKSHRANPAPSHASQDPLLKEILKSRDSLEL